MKTKNIEISEIKSCRRLNQGLSWCWVLAKITNTEMVDRVFNYHKRGQFTGKHKEAGCGNQKSIMQKLSKEQWKPADWKPRHLRKMTQESGELIRGVCNMDLRQNINMRRELNTRTNRTLMRILNQWTWQNLVNNREQQRNYHKNRHKRKPPLDHKS